MIFANRVEGLGLLPGLGIQSAIIPKAYGTSGPAGFVPLAVRGLGLTRASKSLQLLCASMAQRLLQLSVRNPTGARGVVKLRGIYWGYCRDPYLAKRRF